jgi:hypothetical protein
LFTAFRNYAMIVAEPTLKKFLLFTSGKMSRIVMVILMKHDHTPIDIIIFFSLTIQNLDAHYIQDYYEFE